MVRAKNKAETIYGTSPKNLFENINRVLKEDKLVALGFKNLIVKKYKNKQVIRVTITVHEKSKSL